MTHIAADAVKYYRRLHHDVKYYHPTGRSPADRSYEAKYGRTYTATTDAALAEASEILADATATLVGLTNHALVPDAIARLAELPGVSITSEPSDTGYDSSCSWGTAFWSVDGSDPHMGPCCGPNARVNKSAFTKYTVRFSSRQSWAAIEAAFGADTFDGNRRSVDGVTVWNSSLVETCGRGRGLCVAVGFVTVWGKDDQRRCPHITLNADGTTRTGIFG